MKKLLFVTLPVLLLLAMQASGRNVNITSYASGSSVYANPDTIRADSTHTDTVRVVDCQTLLGEVTIDSLSDSLHIALLGSNDLVHFTNLSTSGYTTITTVGEYAFLFTNAEAFRYYTLDFQTHYGTGDFRATVRFKPALRF